MNRLSIVSRRTNGVKQTYLYLNAIRPHTSFEHYHAKYNRPDRWRVEPFPIAAPYHHNEPGYSLAVPAMDGKPFYSGRWKRLTWHWRGIIQLVALFVTNIYCARQWIEYENLFAWGREEALAQMNYRSMRDEELIYLWVRYNQVKNGDINEGEVYRQEIRNDYGFDNIY